jgi:hypothetical protein
MYRPSIIQTVYRRGAGNLACSRLSGGFFALVQILARGERSRLKARCSQDWLPHKAASPQAKWAWRLRQADLTIGRSF